MILAVTGHRPDKLGGYDVPNPTYMAVCEEIDRTLMEVTPDVVLTGMALGVDQWTAEICIDNDIPFVAAVPFEGQDGKWPKSSRDQYHKILEKAHQIVLVTKGGYAPHKMHIRNEWLIKNSDLLMAVWNGTSGGTGACIEKAQSLNHPIKLLKLPANIPPPPERWGKKYPAVASLPPQKSFEADFDPMWNLYTKAGVPIPQAPKFPKMPKPVSENQPPGGGRYVDLGED